MKSRKILFAIAIIEIFLFMNMGIADSYRIHQTDNLVKSLEIKENDKIKKFIDFGINLLIGILSIKQIGFVSAETEKITYWCCPKTKSGAICQDILVEEVSSCSEEPLHSPCKTTAKCQIGTCIDRDNGICSVGTGGKCEEGKWSNLPITNVEECKSGCCILDEGMNKEWKSKIKCLKEGGSINPAIVQSECKTESKEMGACVLEEKDCKFTTESNCKVNLGGIFYKKSLCSNPDLKTKCSAPLKKSEIATECRNNKVYFLDTCGNIANIYNAGEWNNPDYWKTIQESTCKINMLEDGLLDENSAKTCGNCDGLRSTCNSPSERIKPLDGKYACQDLNCEDEDFFKKFQRRPLNQESWCVYESYVGDSKDVVGSAHWVRYCDKGKIKTDLCDEYRTQICAGRIIEEEGKKYSQARCRANEGWKCYLEKMKSYKFVEGDTAGLSGTIIDRDKTKELNEKKCEEASVDCRLEEIDFYEGPGLSIKNLHIFDVCVPEYPPGLKFWDKSSNAEGLCGTINSAKCTTKWEYDGSWYCKGNCECLEPEFKDLGGKTRVDRWATQMNELCGSLGDCGGKANVVGVYTKNFRSSSLKDFTPFINIGGKETYVMKEIQDGRERQYSLKGDLGEDEIKELKDYANKENRGKGDLPEFFTEAEMNLFGGDPLKDIGYLGGNFPQIAKNVLQYSGIALGAVAMVLTSIVVPALSSATASITAAIVAGTAAATATVTLAAVESASSVVPIVGWVIAAIAAIIEITLIVLMALGFWETKEIVIEFECQPWQAPIGGKDCKKCNEDPSIPCTEYKCKSLGSSCQIVDNLYESENPLCISSGRDDITPPKIYFEKIQGSYMNKLIKDGVEIRDSNGGCIQEFSSINFTLKTANEEDKEDYVECVYNWGSSVENPSSANNYDLEGNEFKEGNFNSATHTFEGKLPFLLSPDVSKVKGNIGEREGELNMYVKCIDANGNVNTKDYIVNLCIKEGPDKTPASIVEYVPETGSFLTYGKSESYLSVLLDEPAECRWTLDVDKDYNEMNNFTLNSISGCDRYNPWELKSRWTCSTKITDLIKPENNIYIKCKDQPWINEPGYSGAWKEEDRNINEEGFLYTLYQTGDELEIYSISPSGEIIGGKDSAITNLIAGTSGGAEEGKAICRYDFTEPQLGGDIFFQTISTEHKQPLYLVSGNYNINVTCEDSAGNKAQKDTKFKLSVDIEPPKIIRVYHEETYLKIITDESAKCVYDTKYKEQPCDYLFDTAKSMKTMEERNHYISWDSNSTFYIVCQDKYGNKPELNQCSKIVKPEILQ